MVSKIRRIPGGCRKLGLLLLIAVAGCTQIVYSQAQNRIEGRLQAGSGSKLPDNIKVTLKLFSGSQVDSVMVSGNARFSFRGLSAGKYVVSVHAEGFFPVEEQVEIPSGYIHNIVNVIINLRPRKTGDAVQKLNREKTVSIGSLKVPSKAQKEVAEAEKAAAKGRYREAIKHAEKALDIYPDYFEAYNNSAVYHYQEGEAERAVELFGKALKLNPQAVRSHINLGRVYLELSRPKQAIPHFKRAAELNPSSSEIHYHLGRAFILAYQFGLSVKPLRKALELDPPVEHARFFLAHVLYELGNKSDAVYQLELYLKSDPKDRRKLGEKLNQWKSELGQSAPY